MSRAMSRAMSRTTPQACGHWVGSRVRSLARPQLLEPSGVGRVRELQNAGYWY